MQRNKGAVDKAFDNIIKLVLSKKLQPGDRIYETDLVDVFKMSRTPIREALSRLASMGFLEKLPNKKGYIIPFLEPEDMKEVYYVRVLLESKAARRAAKYANPEDVNTLIQINQQEIEKFLDDKKDEYAALNEKFHMTIAAMAKNRYLYRYIQQAFWRSNIYVFFFMSFYNEQFNFNKLQNAKNPRLSCMEHKRIVESILSKDSLAAEKAMQEHLIIAYNSMLNPRIQPIISLEEFDLD
jgi:DNA-binding GntR family transcriptional regulator